MRNSAAVAEHLNAVPSFNLYNFLHATESCNCVRWKRTGIAMPLDRGKLANVDRRLFAEITGSEDWQQIRVPATPAKWSTWKRYCQVIDLPIARAVAALIDTELASVTDDEIETSAAVIKERMRQLDDQAAALDTREKEIERREKRLGINRPMTQAEIARTAAAVEPSDDPGWSSVESSPSSLDPSIFTGVGRNELCPCGSDLKFKKCHGAPTAST
jgi:hypothetical protein